MTKITGYNKMISETTGVTDLETLEEIQDCMRHTIFHSTLDWQTREQFDHGAVQAWEVIKYERTMA